MAEIQKDGVLCHSRGSGNPSRGRRWAHFWIPDQVRNDSARITPNRNGFTIVELLVAVGLFLTVLAVLSGAFVEALRSERATLRLMAANDNASFVLEQMAREIRVGTDFLLTNPSELRFINSAGREVTYRLTNGRVEKQVGASGAFAPITTNTVRVEALSFALTGESKTDDLQPRLTIALAVGATGRDIAGVVTRVQTTITPRLLDRP